MLTSEQIQKILDNHSTDVVLYKKQLTYYKGLNAGIYKNQPKENPDNRIPIPIARRAVKLVLGYMAKPGSIVYSGQFYEDFLKDLFNEEEEDLFTAELLEDVLKHGVAYELHYTELDEETQKMEPCFAQIPVDQGIPIYSKTLKRELIGFLYYFCDDIAEKEYVWYYDEEQIYKYERTKNTKADWLLSPSLPDDLNPSYHAYQDVPVICYQMSKDCSNLYDHVRPLMDWYDKVISQDYADELERFANAYLLIGARLNPEADADTGETEIDKIKRTRTFENLGEDVLKAIGFLTKPANDPFISSAADRAERLIYEMLMLFNPADEKFNAATGIAMAYKLLTFEYLCTSIEAYFSKGLQRRIDLIENILTTLGLYSEPENDADNADAVFIDFKRNLPFDLSAIADIALKLKGILSQETILKLFPSTIVNDVQEEMKAVNAEIPSFDSYNQGASTSSGNAANASVTQNMDQGSMTTKDGMDTQVMA